jgi:hypothetical protein
VTSSIASLHLSAQTDTSTAAEEIIVNGKHYQAVDNTKPKIVKEKKKEKPTDSSFVLNNNKFQYFNNWVNIGLGGQQNITYQHNLGFVGSLDCYFHIKHEYFQGGFMITGNSFGDYDNYQLHVGYGKRFEDRDYQFAAFLNVTYSSGVHVTQVDSLHSTERVYSVPGLYAEGEVVKKVTYDLGLGACLFVDWNQEQSMIGLKFVLYFSGGYSGKKFKVYQDVQSN